MSGNIVESLKASLNDILGVRDAIGAVLHPVYITTRTYASGELDSSEPEVSKTRILPTPSVKEYKHTHNLPAGGSIAQGDIFVSHISKQSYPNRSDIDCSSDDKGVEKLYELGDYLYQVVSVTEDLLTWSVQLRKINQRSQ